MCEDMCIGEDNHISLSTNTHSDTLDHIDHNTPTPTQTHLAGKENLPIPDHFNPTITQVGNPQHPILMQHPHTRGATASMVCFVLSKLHEVYRACLTLRVECLKCLQDCLHKMTVGGWESGWEGVCTKST